MHKSRIIEQNEIRIKEIDEEKEDDGKIERREKNKTQLLRQRQKSPIFKACNISNHKHTFEILKANFYVRFEKRA